MAPKHSLDTMPDFIALNNALENNNNYLKMWANKLTKYDMVEKSDLSKNQKTIMSKILGDV